MTPWLQALCRHDRDGKPSVVITILSVLGSAPREAGCKMVISHDSVDGTIGGGTLEFECIAIARRLLVDGVVGPVQREFALGPALGQCCGGFVSVLFEPMQPASLHLALFGAGHIGQALVRLLADLPCRVKWIDSRPEVIPAILPDNVSGHLTAVPQREIHFLTPGTFVLVMTHDHHLDYEIIEQALSRDDLTVGLIGSVTKSSRFRNRLRRAEFAESTIDRLICPVGIPGIRHKQPEAIAISIAAQILRIMSETDGIKQRHDVSAREICA
jgi:xanthine dehydrogenase accessory factor